jgi:hypothetical protein
MIERQNPVRGFLQSINLKTAIKVKFQYNPTQLTDKRSVTYATLNAPALLMPVRQYSQGGDRTLSFTVRVDGVFTGPADAECEIAKDEEGSILPELNKYRAFLYPKNERWNSPDARASFVPLYDGNQDFTSPPLCLFGFGTERIIKCVVTEIGITELMFNKNLAPLRAEVAITLVEFVPYHNGE